MKPNNDIEPVEVFSGTIWDAELVKSLLENAEILTFLKDENTGTLAPFYAAPGGAGSVKVVVSNLDYDEAIAIIAEYETNMKKSD
jgi:hypothetical protein